MSELGKQAVYCVWCERTWPEKRTLPGWCFGMGGKDIDGEYHRKTLCFDCIKGLYKSVVSVEKAEKAAEKENDQ